jgi:hypothetical protein
LTATWYSLALICVTLSFFACGLTDTEMVMGMVLDVRPPFTICQSMAR